MSKRKHIGLMAFLKGSSNPADQMPGCANYDHHYGGCIFNDTCLVQEGRRCGYFEKAVLPVASELGLQNIYEAYEKQTGAGMLKRSQARICPDCGEPLRPRQKFCDDCTRKRRQKTKRENQRKFRQNQHVSA